MFGSGPQVIGVGARTGDRLTATVGAEPERVGWAIRTAREACAAAGGDPGSLQVGAFVVVCVGTDEATLDEFVRGNTSISAHFQRHVTAALSPGDAASVDRVTGHYDLYHLGLEHATQATGLPDDFLRRFCVIGSPEVCIARLHELIGLGLSHLVFVGASRDVDPVLRERSDHLLATEVLPPLRALAKADDGTA